MRILSLVLLAAAALPAAAHGHHGWRCDDGHHGHHARKRVVVVAPPACAARPLAPPWARGPVVVARPAWVEPAPVAVLPAPRPRVSVWIGF